MDATRPAPGSVPQPTSEQGLARNRIQFLTAEDVDAEQVRDEILTSWRRSKRMNVSANRIELPYFAELDRDTPLIHGAEPVLAQLGEQLDGQPISLILTDANGVVLAQHTGDAELHRHLESVELVPGFSYGEEFVGTNGIGTALQDGCATHVFGHEHYAEHLEGLACAGVPIRHPISGTMLGAVDLTCRSRDAGKLLVALARSTAEQIRQALLTHTNMREFALLRAYLQACRQTTGIAMAFNNELAMMNDCARQLLDADDQAMLLQYARRAFTEDNTISATITLPTGTAASLRCRRVPGPGDGDVAGGVLIAQLVDTDDGSVRATNTVVPLYLPGAVGTSPAWQRCCGQVDAHCQEEDWLILAGESGTGKHTLARTIHQRRAPTGRCRAVDVADNEDVLAELRLHLLDDPVDTLVVRHLDRCRHSTITEATALFQRARSADHAPWVVLTMEPEPEAEPELVTLLTVFPHTVAVPALRRHIADLDQLVPFMLSRLSHGNELSCAPDAMHLLMRAGWPGNVTELHQVLKSVTRHRRSGVIRPTDLPPRFRTASQRELSPIEVAERDTIVQALQDARGNKLQAAKLLNISRATIYRKVHDFGIVVPDQSRPHR
ncbi:MAG: sigma-54-dependent Fis family transcriptional regulator [Nocardioidaceae bacterium]